MLHIWEHGSPECWSFPGRVWKKTAANCPAPCCDIDCDMCAEGAPCDHTRHPHGRGGTCVVRLVPGTGVWALNEAAFSSPEHRAAAVRGLEEALFTLGRAQCVREEDLPLDANMAGWVLVAGEFECLRAFAGSVDAHACRCVAEDDCHCGDRLKEKAAMARPDAPRRRAGAQRAAMIKGRPGAVDR